jgi:hypothetical protein
MVRIMVVAVFNKCVWNENNSCRQLYINCGTDDKYLRWCRGIYVVITSKQRLSNGRVAVNICNHKESMHYTYLPMHWIESTPSRFRFLLTSLRIIDEYSIIIDEVHDYCRKLGTK